MGNMSTLTFAGGTALTLDIVQVCKKKSTTKLACSADIRVHIGSLKDSRQLAREARAGRELNKAGGPKAFGLYYFGGTLTPGTHTTTDSPKFDFGGMHAHTGSCASE